MNIGGAELLVILVFALIIVGPDRLPSLGKTIGRALGQFRDAQNKVNEVVSSGKQKIDEIERNPFLALSGTDKASSGSGGDEKGGSRAEGAVDAAGAADPAGSSGDKSGRKVAKLSDRESFTERKLRLQRQASSGGAVDDEVSADPVDDTAAGNLPQDAAASVSADEASAVPASIASDDEGRKGRG